MKLFIARHHTASHGKTCCRSYFQTVQSSALDISLPYYCQMCQCLKTNTESGTGNISVLGNYSGSWVIDLFDEELPMIYLQFNHLQMKALLRIV